MNAGAELEVVRRHLVLGAPQDANLLLEPRDLGPKRRDLALELLATRFLWHEVTLSHCAPV